MDIQSFKAVKINDEVALQISESENKLAILVAGGAFGHNHVVLTFEEFRQIRDAMYVLQVERDATAKPLPPTPPVGE